MKLPKKRDYPKTLRLGDEVYKVKFVRKFKGCGKTLGECDPEKKEIRIRYGQTPEETFKTFLHEVCHGLIEFEHDIEIKHRMIYKLEIALYQFFIDNF